MTGSETFGSLFVLTTFCDGVAAAVAAVTVVGVTGSGVFDDGEATLVGGKLVDDACDCLRDRIRASCADCAPILYCTISSSKRFRFIERCELHVLNFCFKLFDYEIPWNQTKKTYTKRTARIKRKTCVNCEVFLLLSL